ncbi:HNH endonuclease [Brachyspira hyodysenteriae]|uniref:HNH endonuclease n=1 Tax=Brachyspira hyodysenteriae TaxID=159 RepID=UPI003BF4BFF0
MSEEHIIPNALGGKYKSSKICCKKCNNDVLSEIDAKFSNIFSYIIHKIPNFKREK